MNSHLNKDGTRSFLIDALDKADAINALSKFNLEILEEEDAIFDSSGNVSVVEFVIRGSEDNVSFALDSITKMIRPYPASFRHKR